MVIYSVRAFTEISLGWVDPHSSPAEYIGCHKKQKEHHRDLDGRRPEDENERKKP